MPRNRLGLWVTLPAVLFCLQLTWWGVLIARQARELHDAQVRALLEQSRLAQQLWEQQGGGQAGWERLAGSFDGISYEPANAERPIQPSSAALQRLDQELQRRQLMVVGEGTLFALLVLSALWLLQRTVRREAYLALQHENFLHAVTHEFRSPLQTLRLTVETLLRRPDPARARGYGEGMLEDIRRLEELVENLLAVGRLDASAFRAEPRRMDLSRAVEERLHGFLKGDGSPPDWLRSEIEPGLEAEVDPATLDPILRNLLDNARKYGEGRPVVLRLRREGDRVLLQVADQGLGFSAADRPHLFQRFWRAGDERTRTSPGVGLGLFLVAELARAQGARTDARSDGPGRGAEFTVSWPAA